MLIKPVDIINDDVKDPFKQRHTGRVVDNNDPEKRKRVKVLIDLWDYLEDDNLPWVKQENLSSGVNADEAEHHIPEIGADVVVYFKNGSPDDPVYTGAETTEENRCSLFDEDYPNTYGYRDKIGNFMMNNKKTGISVYHHNSGSEVQLDPDGSLTVTNPSGAYARCNTSGEWEFFGPKLTFNIDDELNINASSIKMTARQDIALRADTTTIGSKTSSVFASEGGILIGSTKANVTIKGNEITAEGNFGCNNGVDTIFIDLLSKRPFVFNKGILTGVKL